LLFEAEMAKKNSRKTLTHRYKEGDLKKIHERNAISNDKNRRRINTEEKKITIPVKGRAPTTMKTDRSVEEKHTDKITPMKKTSRLK
jgi:hypothetical protein